MSKSLGFLAAGVLAGVALLATNASAGGCGGCCGGKKKNNADNSPTYDAKRATPTSASICADGVALTGGEEGTVPLSPTAVRWHRQLVSSRA